jgi:hypothetical protein
MNHNAWNLYAIRVETIVPVYDSNLRYFPISRENRDKVIETQLHNQLADLPSVGWEMIQEFIFEFNQYGLFQNKKYFVIVNRFNSWCDRYVPFEKRVVKEIWNNEK